MEGLFASRHLVGLGSEEQVERIIRKVLPSSCKICKTKKNLYHCLISSNYFCSVFLIVIGFAYLLCITPAVA